MNGSPEPSTGRPLVQLERIMSEKLRGRPRKAGELMAATRATGVPLFRRRAALSAMLQRQEAMVRVPLALLDDDTVVHGIRLVPGGSTRPELEALLGPAMEPGDAELPGSVTWLLHRQAGPRERGDAPYRHREAANPMRPQACSLPFSLLHGGESLVLTASFDGETLTGATVTVR